MEIEDVNHYACAGECRSESEKPATCSVENCSMYGKPMVSCTCVDGRHQEVWKKEIPSPAIDGF